ncbi:MAG: 7-carboxy-7-deazaguanine synthase QueE [Candidatus Omnitrophica bacterium]|nr:7-carboxy-7-deazaguanine synthase QueE [Candidatus Omnitrophota bacterium]
MDQAKVSEIFLSYQGEGLFAGSRQLFVRFYDCNLNCSYCDTPRESYKSFTKEALLAKILDFEDDYNEIALTGGEPLLYADFLKTFIPLFRRYRQHPVYLETNGTLWNELEKIIDFTDIIAMDIKLPSSGGGDTFWKEHEAFIKIAAKKELIVKAVITDSTTIDDIKKMGDILSSVEKKFLVVLQPVTAVNDKTEQPDGEMISYFKGYLLKETRKDVVILGQIHKYLGVR